MEAIQEFMVNNYIWITIVCLFLIFTLIGYMADKSNKKSGATTIIKENPVPETNLPTDAVAIAPEAVEPVGDLVTEPIVEEIGITEEVPQAEEVKTPQVEEKNELESFFPEEISETSVEQARIEIVPETNEEVKPEEMLPSQAESKEEKIEEPKIDTKEEVKSLDEIIAQNDATETSPIIEEEDTTPIMSPDFEEEKKTAKKEEKNSDEWVPEVAPQSDDIVSVD